MPFLREGNVPVRFINVCGKMHDEPFRRNDEMLKLELVGLIATPSSGITDNLVDKATKKNIKVKRLGQQA